MKLLVETYQSPLSPWQLFQAAYASAEKSFFLDSILHKSPDQNYSYLGADPFLEVSLRGHKIYLSGARRGIYPAKKIFDVLRKIFKDFSAKPDPRYPFFTGGAVGFFGYELAPVFDKVAFRSKPDPGTPKLYLGFFRDVIIYDHAKKHYYLATYGGRKNLEKLKVFFNRAEKKPLSFPQVFHVKKFRPGISRARFEAMVRRAKRYIEAGDIYQANLSQRFSFDFQGSALKLYERLRSINPSPFASFLNLGDLKIISSSPERLVLKKGSYAQTRPIAGTRSRSTDARRDQALENELRHNSKEQAEHIMLVDLERNDLGRVCEFNSVRVEELMKVEKYSHVMHLVSKITGKLASGKDALDLLKAVFPGGTVTGCPKIRCMEIIDELEPVQRGLYTGSIGYIDFNGDMDMNIVIRTLILRGQKGYLQTGAGIVYDSEPGREYEETLHKGEALVQALVEASL